MARKKLTRRTMLRGGLGAAAVSLARPRLEAMFESSTAFAQGSAHPRFVAFYVPNGVIEERWFPEGNASDYTFAGTALEPLAAHLPHTTALRRLRSPGTEGGGNQHMRGISGFLTGSAIANDRVTELSISIDQFIANHYAEVAPTPVHSLQLAGNNELDPPLNTVYNNALKNALSFDQAGRILPNTANLRAVFNRLFAGVEAPEQDLEAERRRVMRRSVLDSVLTERDRLQTHLGAADRARVEEYFESVRALELRIEGSDAPIAAGCSVPEAAGFPEYEDGPRLHAIGEHARQTAELLRLAFSCDLTRCATYMAGGEAAGCSYRDIDINQHFHNSISHDRRGKANLHHRIDTFHSELVAAFADGLLATAEGEGTLLDSTVITYGSGLGNGDSHDLRSIAFAVVSRLGRFAEGRYLQDLDQRSSGDALMTILEEMGLPQGRFGDSRNALSV
ncbi:MAG: DUF1552 domain-containing protein [Myxococcota bacterium]